MIISELAKEATCRSLTDNQRVNAFLPFTSFWKFISWSITQDFFLLFIIWYVKIFEVHMFTCPPLAVVMGCYSQTYHANDIWSEYCWDHLCSWLPVKIWRCNTSFKAYTTAIIPPWSTYSVRIQCTEFMLACLSLCHLTSSLCALMRPYIALVYLPQFPSRFLPRPIRYYLESFGLVACSTS